MLYSSYKPKVQGHGLWLFWVCGWTEIGLKTGDLRFGSWTWACKLLCCFPSLFVDLFIEPRLETLIKKCFGPEQIFKLQSSNNFMKKEIKLSSVKKKTLGARMECFRLFVENVLQMTLHEAIRRREIDDDWVLYRNNILCFWFSDGWIEHFKSKFYYFLLAPIFVKMMDPAAEAVNHVGVELDCRALCSFDTKYVFYLP